MPAQMARPVGLCTKCLLPWDRDSTIQFTSMRKDNWYQVYATRLPRSVTCSQSHSACGQA